MIVNFVQKNVKFFNFIVYLEMEKIFLKQFLKERRVNKGHKYWANLFFPQTQDCEIVETTLFRLLKLEVPWKARKSSNFQWNSMKSFQNGFS